MDILSAKAGPEGLAAYLGRGGYGGLRRAIAMEPAAIMDELEAAGLRGRGGAAFPTALKWRAVRDAAGDARHLVVNGAEGEPGSFKDRALMARAPHRVLEGTWIAAHALGATDVRFYLNDDFDDAQASLTAALAEASAEGGPAAGLAAVTLMPETHVYLAGEETALINVLMGKPAIPWHKPPYPSQKGLCGEPTAVNNVETLALAALILERGAAWYAGARPVLFSLSGDVRRPGVYEMALGTPLSDLLERAGGAREGERIRAVLPGGYSAPILTERDFDVPLDYEALRERGSGLGASVIALDGRRSLPEVTAEVLAFFARESCGRCPTCIRGCASLTEQLGRWRDGALDEGRLAAVAEQAGRLRHKGICSFLDTAARFTQTSLALRGGPAI